MEQKVQEEEPVGLGRSLGWGLRRPESSRDELGGDSEENREAPQVMPETGDGKVGGWGKPPGSRHETHWSGEAHVRWLESPTASVWPFNPLVRYREGGSLIRLGV